MKSTIKELEEEIDFLKTKGGNEININRISKENMNCINTESKYMENYQESADLENSQIVFVSSPLKVGKVKTQISKGNGGLIGKLENEIMLLQKENLALLKKKDRLKEKFNFLKDKIFKQTNKLTDEVNRVRKNCEMKITKFLSDYSKFLKEVIYTNSKVIFFILYVFLGTM